MAVVFWHWQIFFFSGTQLGPFVREEQPFYRWLALLYNYGGFGVEIFFCLSGFVFYWLYAESIAGRGLSAGDFFVRRFSRLYPLHFFTLLVVAAAQAAFFAARGTFFTYPFNDPYHFILNLGFASSWGFERGFSYNAPNWSISVEVLLYAAFFLFSRKLPVHFAVPLVAAGIGFFFIHPRYAPLGLGCTCFFGGGMVYFIYRRLMRSPWARTWCWLLCGVTLGAWLFTVLVATGVSRPLPTGGVRWWTMLISASPRLGLFPLTILTLALVDTQWSPLARRWAFLGDLSYASYLLHFPLQFAFVSLALHLDLSRAIFYSPVVFVAFFSILITLSLLTHRYVELPAQNYLRRRAGAAPVGQARG